MISKHGLLTQLLSFFLDWCWFFCCCFSSFFPAVAADDACEPKAPHTTQTETWNDENENKKRWPSSQGLWGVHKKKQSTDVLQQRFLKAITTTRTTRKKPSYDLRRKQASKKKISAGVGGSQRSGDQDLPTCFSLVRLGIFARKWQG